MFKKKCVSFLLPILGELAEIRHFIQIKRVKNEKENEKEKKKRRINGGKCVKCMCATELEQQWSNTMGLDTEFIE